MNIFPSGVALIGAGAIWLYGHAITKRINAILATKRTPIKDAVDGPVEIEGTIIEALDAPLLAPLSGEPVVLVRCELRCHGSKGYLHTEDARRRFVVSDETGGRAIVDVGTGPIDWEPISPSKTPIERERLDAFVAERGLRVAPVHRDSVRGTEYVLRVGQLVYVLGAGKVEAAPPVATQFRDAPGTQLLVTRPATGPFILADGGQEVLVARLTAMRTGWRALAIFLAVMWAVLFLLIKN